MQLRVGSGFLRSVGFKRSCSVGFGWSVGWKFPAGGFGGRSLPRDPFGLWLGGLRGGARPPPTSSRKWARVEKGIHGLARGLLFLGSFLRGAALSKGSLEFLREPLRGAFRSDVPAHSIIR